MNNTNDGKNFMDSGRILGIPDFRQFQKQ